MDCTEINSNVFCSILLGGSSEVNTGVAISVLIVVSGEINAGLGWSVFNAGSAVCVCFALCPSVSESCGMIDSAVCLEVSTKCSDLVKSLTGLLFAAGSPQDTNATG